MDSPQNFESCLCALSHKCHLKPTHCWTKTPELESSGAVWRVMAERLRAPDSSSGVWSAGCGFESRSWHLLHKIGEVVLSALPARLRTDDTQAYIRMDCKRGNPVSALGVGGNGLWKKIIVAHTLKWPSGLVCLATCIKKKRKKGSLFHLAGTQIKRIVLLFCLDWRSSAREKRNVSPKSKPWTH